MCVCKKILVFEISITVSLREACDVPLWNVWGCLFLFNYVEGGWERENVLHLTMRYRCRRYRQSNDIRHSLHRLTWMETFFSVHTNKTNRFEWVILLDERQEIAEPRTERPDLTASDGDGRYWIFYDLGLRCTFRLESAELYFPLGSWKTALGFVVSLLRFIFTSICLHIS